MRRREFITLLGGAAAAWPLAASAQSDNVRRIGALMGTPASDPEGQARHAAFVQGLAQLGWSDGHNVRIETRWVPGDPNLYRTAIAELLALTPHVILASGTSSMGPLQQATRTIPIVFVGIVDRWAVASSPACPGRVATPPASSCSNTASAPNGWSCSSRSRRV
jgi:putative ABC transport system substrate-binding protein